MEYQKIINLLNNTPNRPCNFRSKNWIQIKDESRGTYNNSSQFKFKTSMLNSNLYDYSDVYILVKESIVILSTTALAATANNIN